MAEQLKMIDPDNEDDFVMVGANDIEKQEEMEAVGYRIEGVEYDENEDEDPELDEDEDPVLDEDEDPELDDENEND